MTLIDKLVSIEKLHFYELFYNSIDKNQTFALWLCLDTFQSYINVPLNGLRETLNFTADLSSMYSKSIKY